MHPRKAAAVIAAVVLALGVILAVTPLSVGAGSNEVECGSAFSPSQTPAIVADAVDRPLLGSYVAQCEDEVSGRRLIAYSLAGAAALVLLFVWLTGQHETRWDAVEAPAGEADRPSV